MGIIYYRMINEATGVTNRQHVQLIQECMETTLAMGDISAHTPVSVKASARVAVTLLKNTGELAA